jgi:hypothetical protein
MVSIILYLIAVIFLTLEAFAVKPRIVSLGWLGLAIAVFTATILNHIIVAR